MANRLNVPRSDLRPLTRRPQEDRWAKLRDDHRADERYLDMVNSQRLQDIKDRTDDFRLAEIERWREEHPGEPLPIYLRPRSLRWDEYRPEDEVGAENDSNRKRFFESLSDKNFQRCYANAVADVKIMEEIMREAASKKSYRFR